jgi:hypothetical protein
MKYLIALLSVLSAVYVQQSLADWGAVEIKGQKIETSNANPDRRRVAGAALILQHDGTITEPSIPSNTIIDPVTNSATNKIITGTPDFVDITTAPIIK